MFRCIALLVLVFLLISALCSAEAINASDMVFKSSGTAENGGWQLPLNGYVGTIIRTTKPGKVDVKVTAQGNGLVHVHIAGEKQFFYLTKDDYQDCSLTFNLPAGYHNVRIEFPADDKDYFHERVVATRPGRVTATKAPQTGRRVTVKSIEFAGDDVSIMNSGSDADCLAAADSYIENYRKTNISFKLTGVKPGTPVNVSMVRNGYIFGAAIKGTNPSNTTYLDKDVDPGSDEGKYAAFITSHFNTIVPENAGKWGHVESKQGKPDMQTVDAMLGFASRNHLRSRMHTIVWHQQLPAWAQSLAEKAAAGDREAKADLRKAITKRIKYYVTERAGQWEEVDVVNEFPHGLMSKIFSTKELAGIYAEAGRVANRRARMAINDYGFESAGKDYANWYKTHIQDLLDNGATINAIGLQYHTGSWHSASLMSKLLNSVAVFEFPTTITEFSVGDKSKPDTILDQAMRMAFGNDQSIGFVMWDFYRPWMWNNGAALVEKDWTITECGKVYDSLRSKWSTNLVTTVDKDGFVKFRGFYGDYNLSVGGKIFPASCVKDIGNESVEDLISL